MTKEELRNKLFEKYFEVKDGFLATEIVDKLSFIPETWSKLHLLCEKNIKHFCMYDNLEMIKVIEYKNSKYLIIKLRLLRYVIIDLNKMENISENEFKNIFDEEFFVKNFNEIENKKGNKKKNKSIFPRLYSVKEYLGNIEELYNLYVENEKIFLMPNNLHYEIKLGDAFTFFYIDFANASAQMSFQTPNQFIYEQLFFNYDLTYSRSQDAIEKIGAEKMQEMFDRIKKIEIPKEVIPKEFLKYINDNKEKNKIETSKLILRNNMN